MSDPRMYPQGRVSAQSTGVIGEMQFTETLLTHAQLITLEATSVILVPAPGPGKWMEFITAQLRLNSMAGAYDDSATQLRIKYASGTGRIVSTMVTSFFSRAAGNHVTIALPQMTQAGAMDAYTQAEVENQPFVLHDNFGSGELTLGHVANTLRVVTSFRVWPAIW